MPVDPATGQWNPGLFPKQEEVRACAAPSKQNMVLVSGPRWSGKTWGVHAAAIQHAWDTNNAEVCIVTVTQAVGVESGVWQHLTETFIPDWIEADFGMEWVRKPYLSGATKRPICSIRNKHGTISRFCLESLRTEEEVEARFKGKEYSLIWLAEGTKFRHRWTFDTLKQCFRKPHLKPEEHLFICDTNPSLEEGREHFLYKLFYDFRTDQTVAPEFLPLRNSLKLIEFTIDDNLSLSAERKQAIMADFMHDPDLVAAYYYGKWTTASADAIFFKQFRPLHHVIGETHTSDPDPEMMWPERDCVELFTGWDPGPTNCAAVVVEKVVPPNGKPIFKVLDELVWVDKNVDLAEFIQGSEDVQGMLQKMEFWAKSTGREVDWTHHSDRSVFEMQDMESKKFWQQMVFEMSNGAIELQAFERGPGTLLPGIQLIKMLLFDQRIYINGPKCPNTVMMFKSIRKGKQIGQHIAKGDPNKHVFDALRYVLQAECYGELNRKIVNSIRRKSESSLVSIPV